MNEPSAATRSPDEAGVELDTSVGYLLKETATALRARMEEALRPLGMNVTRYACLELLAQRPGLSGAELARGVFVTRQSMNVVLQALEDEGLVHRTASDGVGRAIPTALTPAGRRRLRQCTVAVRAVEDGMLAPLADRERRAVAVALRTMRDALRRTTTSQEGDEEPRPRP